MIFADRFRTPCLGEEAHAILATPGIQLALFLARGCLACLHTFCDKSKHHHSRRQSTDCFYPHLHGPSTVLHALVSALTFTHVLTRCSLWLFCLLSFFHAWLFPIKKAGQRDCSGYPPVLVARFLLPYQVPSFLEFCFKRPQVNIDLNLVFAFEILWHSPRVPARTASAIPEFAGCQHVSCLVDDSGFRIGDCPIISSDEFLVLLPGLTDDSKVNRYARAAPADTRFDQKRRAKPERCCLVAFYPDF